LAAAALALVASPVPCRASKSLAAISIPARPSPGCRATRPAERGERLDRVIEVAGVDRRYVLDVPSAPDPRTPLPLLLDFHGLGHSGAGVWKVSGFRALARETPFVTAYPEGLPVRLVTPTRVFEGVGWEVQRIEGNRDLAFVSALVDRIAGEYCIDLARVWATGFSNGAFLAQLLGCTMADRIAAVAPVSGGALRDVSCEPSRPVPILIHHGRWDPIIPVGQGRAARDAWTKVDACTVDAPGPAQSPNGVAATPTAGSVPTSTTAAPIATASATAESASPAPSASAGAVAGANRRAAAPLPTRAPDEDDADAREVAEAASVSCELRARCRAGSSVAYCEGDFGHWWPSGASERVRDFLFAHPMPAR
ncbi:MAG: alpha/beta hydrolase family esterase, partial [Alphaproteobacteria bacterium]